MKNDSGTSLAEVLLVLSLTAAMAGMAVPIVTSGLDESRTASAASYLASQLRLARMDAVKRSRAIGARFNVEEASYPYTFYVDGNANGLRTADIERLIDSPLGGPERIGDNFSGIRFGIALDVPSVDGTENLAAGADPIRIGRSNILTFTPAGTATGGTLYLCGRGGSQYAVRVLGVTGRTRVLKYLTGEGTWLER